MKSLLKLSLALLALVLVFAGCDENPVKSDEHDHAEAVGLVITQSGAEIARYEQGAVTGKITVNAGEETPLLSVKFIDEHDGDLFVPEEDHYSLAWTIADVSVAEVEQHAEDGKWKFHIKGKATGTTTIEIKILHDDHADFVSLPITIEVAS